MGVSSWEQYKKGVRFKWQRQDRHRKQLVNHLEFNSCLVTKNVRHVAQGLFKSIKAWFDTQGTPHKLFDVVPATYYVVGPGPSSRGGRRGSGGGRGSREHRRGGG